MNRLWRRNHTAIVQHALFSFKISDDTPGFLYNQDSGSNIPRIKRRLIISIKPPAGYIRQVNGRRSESPDAPGIFKEEIKDGGQLREYVASRRRELDSMMMASKGVVLAVSGEICVRIASG